MTANSSGPEDAGKLLDDGEEAEILARLVAGNQAGEKRAAQSLGAPLHHPDQDRQGSGNASSVRIEVADDADPRVGSEPEEDRPLGPDLAGQHAEEKREGNADELDEQDRALIIAPCSMPISVP